jgi:acetyl-CoA C-acetyltransferase
MVAAGGMESMSRAPFLAPGAREGLRLGHGRLVDSMIHDGLWDPYGDKHMGTCAELCATEYGLSREDQDAYSR